MVRNFRSIVLAGAFVAVVSPVFAAEMIPTPMGDFDIDPFNILMPAPAAAPAAAPMMKKHHHMKKHHMMKHMKKKM